MFSECRLAKAFFSVSFFPEYILNWQKITSGIVMKHCIQGHLILALVFLNLCYYHLLLHTLLVADLIISVININAILYLSNIMNVSISFKLASSRSRFHDVCFSEWIDIYPHLLS